MKILLAEDEPALAGALKKILENAGAFCGRCWRRSDGAGLRGGL